MDIIMISQKKFVTFLEAQFFIDGLSHYYHLDRKIKSGGILHFVRQDISSKRIKGFFMNKQFEGFLVELNLTHLV